MNITTADQIPFGAAFMIAGTELMSTANYVATASINPAGTHLSDGHHPAEEEESAEEL